MLPNVRKNRLCEQLGFNHDQPYDFAVFSVSFLLSYFYRSATAENIKLENSYLSSTYIIVATVKTESSVGTLHRVSIFGSSSFLIGRRLLRSEKQSSRILADLSQPHWTHSPNFAFDFKRCSTRATSFIVS
jgi:hypothetical protein